MKNRVELEFLRLYQVKNIIFLESRLCQDIQTVAEVMVCKIENHHSPVHEVNQEWHSIGVDTVVKVDLSTLTCRILIQGSGYRVQVHWKALRYGKMIQES